MVLVNVRKQVRAPPQVVIIHIESQVLRVVNISNPSTQEAQPGWLLEVQLHADLTASPRLARDTE